MTQQPQPHATPGDTTTIRVTFDFRIAVDMSGVFGDERDQYVDELVHAMLGNPETLHRVLTFLAVSRLEFIASDTAWRTSLTGEVRYLEDLLTPLIPTLSPDAQHCYAQLAADPVLYEQEGRVVVGDTSVYTAFMDMLQQYCAARLTATTITCPDIPRTTVHAPPTHWDA